MVATTHRMFQGETFSIPYGPSERSRRRFAERDHLISKGTGYASTRSTTGESAIGEGMVRDIQTVMLIPEMELSGVASVLGARPSLQGVLRGIAAQVNYTFAQPYVLELEAESDGGQLLNVTLFVDLPDLERIAARNKLIDDWWIPTYGRSSKDILLMVHALPERLRDAI